MPEVRERSIEVRAKKGESRTEAIQLLEENFPGITIGVPGFHPAAGYYVIVWGGGVTVKKARGVLAEIEGITVK